MGMTQDAALQGCHVVITEWTHGLKQRTESIVPMGVPADKWHPDVILHLSTWAWGEESGMGGGQASLVKGCQF